MIIDKIRISFYKKGMEVYNKETSERFYVFKRHIDYIKFNGSPGHGGMWIQLFPINNSHSRVFGVEYNVDSEEEYKKAFKKCNEFYKKLIDFINE